MKVSGLIKMLQSEDPNMEVYFSYPTHDHWRTEVARSVEDIWEETITYSDYHGMETICDADDKINKIKRVLVLR